MKDVTFLTTNTIAIILKEHESILASFDLHSEIDRHWAFVDLKASTNYRIARGARLGYVRSEAFFSMVRNIIAPTEDVLLVKEIGDAVFLVSESFSRLLESIVLMDHVSHQLAAMYEDSEYPFAIRAGISNGLATRLVRDKEDYLGQPIDELSRIMAVRDASSNILIHEQTYKNAENYINIYPFITIGETNMVPSSAAKGTSTTIFYRAVHVDSKKLSVHKENFADWRKERK